MRSELTPRQWALYNYLKDKGDSWTFQAQCAAEIDDYQYSGDEDFAAFHDSAVRQQITADIRAINNSGIIQKIIISGRNGIKLANSEEFERYINREIKAAVRRLLRAKIKAAKGSREGQLRLTFGGEREIIQAFTDSNKVGEEWQQARRAAGLTQKQAVAGLSKYIKIDAPTLSRIENGVCLPTGEQAQAFIKFYVLSDETQQNEKTACK